ncbi:CCN family member 1-like [Ranitomeya variabilis]|uniref:CCN family member 1-like n=1 Tax=Ranitomeya variabilis TaxID=490064 RepID=UPI004057CBE7
MILHSLWTMSAGSLLLAAAFLGTACSVKMGEPSCPSTCICPKETSTCAPGISLVADSCDCCKVCARQYNQDCDLRHPCDHIKGLHCDFGADSSSIKGICRAKSEGRPCEFFGQIYQNGENFQPNCKHQCSCMDGVVGCMPLCPQEMALPSVDCINPRLVKVPGQCCEEWMCDSNHISEDSGDTTMGDLDDILKSSEEHLDQEDVEPVSSNELITLVRNGFKVETGLGPHPQPDRSSCAIQTTEWSQCSKSCGMGLSARITNDNPQCKLMKETRLCQIRLCKDPLPSKPKNGKKCTRTKKAKQAMHFTYAGCNSVRRYKPNYCGSCTDGRCCTPSKTRTMRVRFRCDDGDTFQKSMMWIEKCRCHQNCPYHSELSYPHYRLHNDIHKFTD